jgi:hypothetical protein
MHAFGADCLYESGKLVMIGESVDSWPGATIPFYPRGWSHSDMTIKDFNAIIDITSPSSAKTTMLFTGIVGSRLYNLVVLWVYYPTALPEPPHCLLGATPDSACRYSPPTPYIHT